MKGSGKSTPKFKSLGKGIPNVPYIPRNCKKVDCNAKFKAKAYRVESEWEFCPKHREEFKEQEANVMAMRIEAKQKATGDSPWL